MIGVTISHRQLSFLGLSISDAIKTLQELGIRLVRIACYWDEIEKHPNTYDFTYMDNLLEQCERGGINKIVLTIGMKAPRYPEYYIPPWLKEIITLQKNTVIHKQTALVDSLLSFLSTCINRYKTNHSISYWQVENEPLDPSGPLHLCIHPDLLRQEVEIVKKGDTSRPIILTAWGNELSSRNVYQLLVPLANIVGLDLYTRVPSSSFFQKRNIRGPKDPDAQLESICTQIVSTGKKLWISELQAEPWTYPETFLPHHMAENNQWSKQFEAEHTMLWGYEFWLAQKQKGNSTYMIEAKKIMSGFA